MASEKKEITIVIVGEDTARSIAKTNLHNFVRNYCAQNQKPIPVYLQGNPDSALPVGHVLQDFSFDDYSVNVRDTKSNERVTQYSLQRPIPCDAQIEVIEKNGSVSLGMQSSFGAMGLPEKSTIQRKFFDAIKSQPWYQKSWRSLVFGSLCLMLSIVLFIAFTLTGLLLTPFLALPVVFLVLTAVAGIKIAYDNRPPQFSQVSTQELDVSTTRTENLSDVPSSRSDGALSYSQKDSTFFSQKGAHKTQSVKKTENLDIGELLVRQDEDPSYASLKLHTRYENKHPIWEDVFKDKVQFQSLKQKDFSESDSFLELSFNFFVNNRESYPLNIAICNENAPFIKEMIEKNYCDAFMKDGKDTELKTKTLSALNEPLKSIPTKHIFQL